MPLKVDDVAAAAVVVEEEEDKGVPVARSLALLPAQVRLLELSRALPFAPLAKSTSAPQGEIFFRGEKLFVSRESRSLVTKIFLVRFLRGLP